MKGTVDDIRVNKNGVCFAFITSSDGTKYYTNEYQLAKGYEWDDLHISDAVNFTPGQPSFDGGFPTACDLSLLSAPIRYYSPVYSQSLDKHRIEIQFLKPHSGEMEILEKLSRHLYI